MSSIKNVVIAGGSGRIGAIFVNEFLKSQKFNVFVLTRENSISTIPPGVHVLKTDYTVASLTPLFTSSRIDAVVSALHGPAIGEPQVALINAAKAAGVRRFVPSEFGSNTTNPEVLELVGLLMGKKKIVDYLKTKEGDGFEWTSLITGGLLDWGIQHDFLALNFKERKFYEWDSGAVPFSVTNVATIAKALINLFSSSDRLGATANRYIFLASHTVTQKELFDALRKATPREEWTVEHVDSKAVASKVKAEVAKGNFSASYELIQYVMFAEGVGDLGDLRTVVSNGLLGLDKEDLEVDVKNIVEGIKNSQ